MVQSSGRALDQSPDHTCFAPSMGAAWGLDPSLAFLNHGSYGATPLAVQEVQSNIRATIELDPVRFLKVDLEPALDEVRASLASTLNCLAPDLALVPNATYALCTVLQSTPLRPGDQVLVTDHEYQSLLNELERVTVRTGANVVTAPVPFPIRDADQVADALISAITDRTRLVCISHVTSATGLVFPVDRVVRECHRRSIDVLVDGAHAVGQIPVDIRALNPTYYIGSGHKWFCGPRASGFIYVRPDKQRFVRPVNLGSRAHKIRPDRSLFLRDFDYLGTDDRTPLLALPAAIAWMRSLVIGGWPAIMRSNHNTVIQARAELCQALEIDLPAPQEMIGCMATIPLPDPPALLMNRPTQYDDALQDALRDRHGIVVPVWRWGPSQKRALRISAQVYNSSSQYQHLATALREELAREWSDGE